MIGHQAICPDRDLLCAAESRDELEVVLVVFLTEECLLSGVSPQGDMVGHARSYHTCQSSHGGKLTRPELHVKSWVWCPRNSDEPLRLRRIGMIFQDDLLFPHLNVAANIRFGLRGASRAERQSRLAEIAALCGVEHLLDRRPSTLSGGERQRVGLARTLAPRPRILLCDEPVSALDLPNRQTLIERLRAVQNSEGIPVLYVTHSPAEAVTVGTRLFLLERGRVLAEGPP